MAEGISALRISGFRGASQPFELSFDAKKPVILIFGENGTGKSTIVDALEYVGTSNTSFVDHWKLGRGRRKESFIPTLGKGLTDVSIEMVAGGQTFAARLDGKGSDPGSSGKRPLMKVLRRKSLQAFIDADPAQRYQEVSAFLDIPQIEASEGKLRTAAKQAEDRFNAATQASAQAAQHLYGLWEVEGKPGNDGKAKPEIRWARQQAKLDAEQLHQRKQAQARRAATTEALLRAATARQQAAANQQSAQQQLDSASRALQQLEAVVANGNAALVQLLKDAKTYLVASPSEELCPVCEITPIVPSQLVTRLDQRLSAMQQLSDASAAVQKARQRLNSAAEQHEKTTREVLDAAQAVLAELEGLPPEYSNFAQKRTDDTAAALALTSTLIARQSAELPKLQSALDETGKQLSQLNAIRHSVKTLDDKTAEAKRSEQISKRLKQAVDIFGQKRKAYVESVLLQIATAVDRLYVQIHPDEGLGRLKLKLDQGQRGSLLYEVAFADHAEVQPQPYYSESHLDTLGLCIFLALAERASKDCIVVLDDVLGSVDAQHLNRTVDLLISETANLGQIIVTTHYRPLRNRFTNSRTGSSHVQLIDLKPWTLPEGVRYSTPKLAIAELEVKLALDTVPREQIAMDAGRLLENAFDYLALLYGLRMSRKPEPLYTLGELNVAVRGVKSWQVTYDSQTTEIKPLLDALQQLMPIRNEAGAHYNENGELLSDKDITAFGAAALTLLRALVCRECAGLAQKQDNMGHWKCQCGKTTMQPYKV